MPIINTIAMTQTCTDCGRKRQILADLGKEPPPFEHKCKPAEAGGQPFERPRASGAGVERTPPRPPEQ